MNGYNFTNGVRRVLAQARNEAATLGHSYVGCEHELLALLADGGAAGLLLENLGVAPASVAAVLKQSLRRGQPSDVLDPEPLPYNTGAKKSLELAMSEARQLGHSYVGTEHLLIGILREGKNIGAQVLQSFGVTLDNARTEMLIVLGVEVFQANLAALAMSRPAKMPPAGEEPARVNLILQYSNGAVVAKDFENVREAARFLTAR